jgi:hypothetical protein
MSQAVQAGDIKAIQDVLKERFPALKFETTDTGLEEVDKPTETTPTPTPVADVTGETKKEETTASLFGDYMAGLPGGVRELVTTDYKGVRGGRLGEGNYTTASMIPGAQVQTPAPASAPSAGGGEASRSYTQTYNTYYTYNYPQEFPQQTPTQEQAPSSPATATQTQGGFMPAWATTKAQRPTTISQAGGGQVASTTDRGSYVSPSSASAPAGAQAAYERVVERQESTGNIGVLAAAGGRGETLNRNEAAALIAAPGNNREAAQRALNQAEKGNIELSNQARQALEQAASGNKKK